MHTFDRTPCRPLFPLQAVNAWKFEASPQPTPRPHLVAALVRTRQSLMGGHRSLTRLLEIFARSCDVTAIYSEGTSPQNGVIQYAHLPRKASTSRNVAQLQPDLLLVSCDVWPELVDVPCPKIAYVCYWRGLITDPRRPLVLANKIVLGESAVPTPIADHSNGSRVRWTKGRDGQGRYDAACDRGD